MKNLSEIKYVMGWSLFLIIFPLGLLAFSSFFNIADNGIIFLFGVLIGVVMLVSSFTILLINSYTGTGIRNYGIIAILCVILMYPSKGLKFSIITLILLVMVLGLTLAMLWAIKKLPKNVQKKLRLKLCIQLVLGGISLLVILPSLFIYAWLLIILIFSLNIICFFLVYYKYKKFLNRKDNVTAVSIST